MAKAKTGSFWLTESIELTALDTIVQGTIPLSSYVDVGDRQAIAVEEVDFIVQSRDTVNDNVGYSLGGAAGGNTSWGFQVTDLNPNTAFLRADDNSLIASGSLNYDDANSITSIGPDIYPDTFGTLEDARMVVSSDLFFISVFNLSALAANRSWVVTARCKCKIVTLSLKDFMSIAVQSTASSE